MKVTGFTFIKNALIYDYPIVEAIKSILPLCDDFVVAVGKSDDDTISLINSIDKNKIKILETTWDETARAEGRVLAMETDKAFAAVTVDSDWAFYIQGDEVIHEKYLSVIQASMLKYKDDLRVDGLLFNYLHFYGSYDFVGDKAQWYQNEIRIIRSNKSIYSYKDAQGFRKSNNEKLRVKSIDAYVYHYGWVKEPKAMQSKQVNFNKFWHSDKWIDKNIAAKKEFDYLQKHIRLTPFKDTHPAVMQDRINSKHWKFDYVAAMHKMSVKDKIKNFAQQRFGLNFNYKNFTRI